MARHSRAIIVSVENPTPKGFFSRLPALSLAQGLVAAAFIIASAFLGAVHLTLKSDAGPAQWLAIHDVASTQWKNPTTLPAEHASIVHFPVREDARDAAAALPAKAAPWRFEGWAYDLLTLRPVPNALLVFRDRQNRVCAQTVSDGDGQFKASFDPLEGGCVLRVHHPSYQEGYLDEMNPRFREVGLNERLGLIKRTAAPLPWLSSGKIPIRRDVFLLPLPPSSSAESPRKQTPRP